MSIAHGSQSAIGRRVRTPSGVARRVAAVSASVSTVAQRGEEPVAVTLTAIEKLTGRCAAQVVGSRDQRST
ncbi:MAG: hypothetical protein GEV28_31635 [Actinophytocola sp.]|uniref:hypothetical protein n=1 Tax=Actinophytocola sp. TaxID=1872138 RepID=UPI00132B2632|nr:hypothetical protein [Actinophytocola sp.]MPZ84692.1 hypothetical protein [Actinophytocola sp.]